MPGNDTASITITFAEHQLACVAAGSDLTRKQLADRIGVCLSTIDKQLSSMRRKLRVRTDAAAVTLAAQLPPPPPRKIPRLTRRSASHAA